MHLKNCLGRLMYVHLNTIYLFENDYCLKSICMYFRIVGQQLTKQLIQIKQVKKHFMIIRNRVWVISLEDD